MSAPVPEQAILGPLIYAPPWARRQPPAGEADETADRLRRLSGGAFVEVVAVELVR